MKKIIFFLLFAFGINLSTFAQDDKTKVKKTSTIPQKVHNTFSRHKRYTGHKHKRKHNGVTTKHISTTKRHETKVKN